MTSIDVFNNVSPFSVGVLMDTVVLGRRETDQPTRPMGEEGRPDGETERGGGPTGSVALIPLAERCGVDDSSFVFHLASAVWALCSSRPDRHLLMPSGLKGSHNPEDGAGGTRGPRG